MFANCLGPAFEMVMAAFHPVIASAESRRNSEFSVIDTEEVIVQEDVISPREETEVEAGNRRYFSSNFLQFSWGHVFTSSVSPEHRPSRK